jgi:Protein of unknown function (DUF3175)
VAAARGPEAVRTKARRTKARGRSSTKRWVKDVKTESTAPPPATFTGSGEQIARTMASRRVSPKGVGSGIRMIQFFINRAGKNLPQSRRRELERAKRILQQRAAREKARAATHT